MWLTRIPADNVFQILACSRCGIPTNWAGTDAPCAC